MKQPFTNAGFLALQAELYLLPDLELAVEANKALTDFKTWMGANFELNAEQVAFLNIIDQRMIRMLAAQTSTALENRLPITLNKEEREQFRTERKRKIIRSDDNAATTADSENAYLAMGSLTITVAYEES